MILFGRRKVEAEEKKAAEKAERERQLKATIEAEKLKEQEEIAKDKKIKTMANTVRAIGEEFTRYKTDYSTDPRRYFFYDAYIKKYFANNKDISYALTLFLPNRPSFSIPGVALIGHSYVYVFIHDEVTDEINEKVIRDPQSIQFTTTSYNAMRYEHYTLDVDKTARAAYMMGGLVPALDSAKEAAQINAKGGVTNSGIKSIKAIGFRYGKRSSDKAIVYGLFDLTGKTPKEVYDVKYDYTQFKLVGNKMRNDAIVLLQNIIKEMFSSNT